jgi:hypothetical protein
MTPSERAEYERLLVADIDRMTALAWQAGNLTYKLHTGQREIWQALHDATAQEALLFISRQWGKSYLSACYALSYCLRNPGSIVRIAAPTLKQAKDIVSDNIGPISADAPKDLITPIKSDYRWKVGESELRLGVLERANVDSLRGGNAKLVICEEGGFVSSDDYDYALRSVIGPQLIRSGGQLIHVTTPSEEPDHYIHTEVYPRCAIAGTKFEFDVYTNPQLTEEQITKAKVLAGGEESAAWRREYLVQIVRDGMSVCVPEFDESKHVLKDEPPEHAVWGYFADFGGIRDKTVSLLCCWNFQKARLEVHDERHHEPNTETDTIVQAMREMGKPYKVRQSYMDAPGQVLVDLRYKHQFDCLLPLKDDFEAGINVVRLAFNQGKILVHERCKFLIQTLRGATFNKQRTDFARSVALGHMDALAALVYANRMVDRTTNPVPEATSFAERVTPAWMHKGKDAQQQEILADTLLNSFGKRKR